MYSCIIFYHSWWVFFNVPAKIKTKVVAMTFSGSFQTVFTDTINLHWVFKTSDEHQSVAAAQQIQLDPLGSLTVPR